MAKSPHFGYADGNGVVAFCVRGLGRQAAVGALEPDDLAVMPPSIGIPI